MMRFKKAAILILCLFLIFPWEAVAQDRSIGGGLTVDADGNLKVTGGGGGTQYNQGGAATATDTMTMMGCVRADTAAVDAGVADGDRVRCIVDSAGKIWVNVGTVTVTGPLTDAQLRATAVPVSGTFWQATQPVSAASLPLPSGASTSALQGGGLPAALGAGGGLKVDGSGTALPVSGTFFQATQPISAVSLPLPTGAATEATLATLNATDFMLGTDFSNVLGTASLILGTQADDLVNTTDGLQTSSMLYVFDGVTWDRLPGNSTDGVLVNLGANNDVTVTGSVTANAGTNLNTSALLTTTAHDAAFGTAGSADAQVRSVQGIASMTPLQVQSNSANLATETTLGNVLTSANFAAAFGTAGSADSQVMSVQGIASMTPVQVSGANANSKINCTNNAFLNMTTATTTEIVALSGSTIIYVCSFSIVSNGATATTVTFVDGTGTNCATSQSSRSSGIPLTAAANTVGIARGSGEGMILKTSTAGDALCVTSSGAATIGVDISFAQF